MNRQDTITSPCRNKCKLSGGICTSCGRTIEEIAGWLNYSEKERKRIMERVKEFNTESKNSDKLNY